MCRFLVSHNPIPFDIAPLMYSFAQYSKTTPAPDSDWQGDGWGMLTNSGKTETFFSLEPIWEDVSNEAHKSSPSNLLVMHARSASFKSQLNDIAFQQPFWNERYAFVFNGFLPNTTLSSPYFSGTSGAQKIWSFLAHMLGVYDPETALSKTVRILKKKSTAPKAINIALVDITNGATWCYTYYSAHPSYYHQQVEKTRTGFMLYTGTMPDRKDAQPIPFDEVVCFTSSLASAKQKLI